MSGAMLDCVVCNTRKWKTLEAAKAGEVRSAGATKLFCSDCGRETYWLFPQNDSGAAPQRKEPELVSQTVSGAGPAVGGMSPTNGGTAAARDEIQRLSRTERRMGADRRARMRRSHRRVSLQLPVRLRVSSNGAQFEEVTRTVNVSRHGIYIQTEQPHGRPDNRRSDRFSFRHRQSDGRTDFPRGHRRAANPIFLALSLLDLFHR